MTILSSFTHPQVVPKLYEFLCSAVNDDKSKIFGWTIPHAFKSSFFNWYCFNLCGENYCAVTVGAYYKSTDQTDLSDTKKLDGISAKLNASDNSQTWQITKKDVSFAMPVWCRIDALSLSVTHLSDLLEAVREQRS